MRRIALWLIIWETLCGALFLSVAHGETVRGKVRDSAGQVAKHVELTAINLATGVEVIATTDEVGNFSIELAPGEHEIFLADAGERVKVGSVEVLAGQDRSLTLAIPGTPASTLDAIRAFEVKVAGESSAQSQELTELINVFPAKKRGRLFGSVYEFHRNDNFDARNFFDPVGAPLPEYKRNQFGLTAGSFITPYLTLQGTFEGLRIIQGSTIVSHIPSPEMKKGDFSSLDLQLVNPFTGEFFPGNQVPVELISPVAQNLFPVIPDPNRADPDRNYVNNDPRVRYQNLLNVRADYSVDETSKLIFAYGFADADQVRVRPLPDFSVNRNDTDHSFGLSYNEAFSDRLLLYSRIDFARNVNFQLSQNAGQAGLLESLGIKGVSVEDPLEEGYPQFELSGYASFGDGDSPETSVHNRLSFESSTTYVWSDHTFRAGFWVQGRQINNNRTGGLRRGRFVFSGNYTGDAFADFLLGATEAASHSIGSDRSDLRRNAYRLWVRDQWRIRPNFDVSAGLNYSYFQPYHSIADNVSSFHPLLFAPPLDGEIVIAGTDRASELGFDDAVQGSLIFPDRNDFSPSLALAYRPFGSNKLVVRASYNLWHDSPDAFHYLSSVTRNYPFYYEETAEASPLYPDIDLSDPFASGASPELTIRGIEPYLKNPYFQTWLASLQNEIARNWNLEFSYQGRRGNHMIRSVPANVPLPGPDPVQERRPNPAFGRLQTVNHGGRYSAHELNVIAEKRLSGGLSFRTGFEWNRSMDDGVWGDPSNPRDLRSEWAPSFGIPPRKLFMNYIFDLPIGANGLLFTDASGWVRWVAEGWRLSGITEIHDGGPFTVRTSGDPNNDGVYGDRPDRLGPGELDPGQRSVDRWFATEDFAEAPPYSFGNSGRNIIGSPGYHVWDISVIKQTRFSDGNTFELRVELFNAFNHTNFEVPDSTLGTSVFGKIFGAERAREIELAVKYSF